MELLPLEASSKLSKQPRVHPNIFKPRLIYDYSHKIGSSARTIPRLLQTQSAASVPAFDNFGKEFPLPFKKKKKITQNNDHNIPTVFAACFARIMNCYDLYFS
jgi:hypothetical protein